MDLGAVLSALAAQPQFNSSRGNLLMQLMREDDPYQANRISLMLRGSLPGNTSRAAAVRPPPVTPPSNQYVTSGGDPYVTAGGDSYVTESG